MSVSRCVCVHMCAYVCMHTCGINSHYKTGACCSELALVTLKADMQHGKLGPV